MNKLYENMNIVKGVRKYEDYSVHFSLIDDVLNESENVEDDINPVVNKVSRNYSYYICGEGGFRPQFSLKPNVLISSQTLLHCKFLSPNYVHNEHYFYFLQNIG